MTTERIARLERALALVRREVGAAGRRLQAASVTLERHHYARRLLEDSNARGSAAQAKRLEQGDTVLGLKLAKGSRDNLRRALAQVAQSIVVGSAEVEARQREWARARAREAALERLLARTRSERARRQAAAVSAAVDDAVAHARAARPGLGAPASGRARPISAERH